MKLQALLVLESFTLIAATIPPAIHDPVEIQVKNVNVRLDEEIVLQIRSLRGQMIATDPNVPVTFDDKNSFVTRIDSGEIAISAAGLSSLLNKYAFAYPRSPLKQIVITTKGGRIKQTGTVHKGVDLPFELEGTLTCTPEGQLRLHAEKFRSAHLPVKGLLHLFGEDLSKLINLREAHGVKVLGDDIILFPDRIIPPPRIEGRVVAVRIEGDDIVQVFGSGRAAKPLSPPREAENYIYHRGGTLRLGRLTMHDADLEIVDMDSRTPFEFYFARYNEQLVAGYSKTTRSLGLVVFMPDYSMLHASRASRQRD